MNIHEYQAKGLLRNYGAPVADGRIVVKSEDAKTALTTIAQFVYHYAREELRMQPVRQTNSNEPLWDNIKDTLH